MFGPLRPAPAQDPVAFSLRIENQDDGELGADANGRDKYVGGAMLKTDPDLTAFLEKADDYRQDGNYQVASKYWQAVLERSSDTLYSDDGETYYSMSDKVESILAQLPPEGLRAYRLTADAGASEVLAQARGEFDIDTLSKIVRTYFISSLGDDAAYKLAGVLLDRFDFVSAIRLLRKITDQYPGPSVPLGEVWLKLAIGYTYLGDRELAEDALQQALAASGENAASSAAVRQVQQLVASGPPMQNRTAAAVDWTMRLGSANRLGIMPSLPADYLNRDLVANFQFHQRPAIQFGPDEYAGQVWTGTAASGEPVADSMHRLDREMIDRWRDNAWRPAGNLLISSDRVVFKTAGDLTVWNREPREQPVWRPLWFNRFVEDEASRTLRQMLEAYGRRRSGSDSPSELVDVLYFADRIHQSVSIFRNVVYNIEGKDSYAPFLDERPPRTRPDQRGVRWGQLPRRSRENALAAYDLSSGKLLWRIPKPETLQDHASTAQATEEQSQAMGDFESLGFMGAPVGVSDLILVPITQAGSISLYALDYRTGELVWKSYLCDEPTTGSDPLAAIEIAVDGNSAYTSVGAGVLFALNPLTGTIQFARRYQRSSQKNATLESVGIPDAVQMDGWDVDLAIPVGNTIILFSSDLSSVWAVDRRTAEFRWQTENRPFGRKFEYLIGILDDYIYVGGPKSIAAISIAAEGRWEWVEEFREETSFGRAILTENGLYVPLEDSIAHYGLKGHKGRGELLSRVGVRLGIDAPVGNLFSDGTKIWVVNGNRLAALQPTAQSAADPADSDEAQPRVESASPDSSERD